MATLGLSPQEKDAVEAFRRTVVEPSMTSLVIIDFWAEWCGPCKQLGPVLEKVAADYADKGVVLAKIDVDADKFIAAQFQVRSIPTVYAMFQGQLAADLTNYRTEGQLKSALDQLLRQLPIQSAASDAAAEIEPLVAMAEEVAATGDQERALSIWSQIAEMAPDNAIVAAGRARTLAALGRLDEAQAALDGVGEGDRALPEVARAASAIELARGAAPVDDLAALAAEVATNPGDHEARMRLAGGQMAAGDRDAAADTLLQLVADDREWNEGAARKQLLTLFEAVGLEDPWVAAQRRRLSAILFG